MDCDTNGKYKGIDDEIKRITEKISTSCTQVEISEKFGFIDPLNPKEVRLYIVYVDVPTFFEPVEACLLFHIENEKLTIFAEKGDMQEHCFSDISFANHILTNFIEENSNTTWNGTKFEKEDKIFVNVTDSLDYGNVLVMNIKKVVEQRIIPCKVNTTEPVQKFKDCIKKYHKEYMFIDKIEHKKDKNFPFQDSKETWTWRIKGKVTPCFRETEGSMYVDLLFERKPYEDPQFITQLNEPYVDSADRTTYTEETMQQIITAIKNTPVDCTDIKNSKYHFWNIYTADIPWTLFIESFEIYKWRPWHLVSKYEIQDAYIKTMQELGEDF